MGIYQLKRFGVFEDGVEDLVLVEVSIGVVLPIRRIVKRVGESVFVENKCRTDDDEDDDLMDVFVVVALNTVKPWTSNTKGIGL